MPATITVTRTSEEDFKQRQLIVHIDGEKSSTLLFGESVSRDVEPGPHVLRVSNTLVWKTVEFVAGPGRADFLRSDQPRGIPDLSDADDPRRRSPLCHDSPHVAPAGRPQRIDDAFAGVTVTVRTAPGLPKDPAARPLIVHVNAAAFPASRLTSRSALSVDLSSRLELW